MAYTTINKSTDYFNTKLYTGNGGTQSITGVGHQPDWTWIKPRSTTGNHRITDAVRGVTKQIYADLTNAENTNTNGLTAFGTDGFTVGSDGGYNGNGVTLASWNWKANGAGSANTDGSINSTVSVNATAGFSIVKWTGTGSNATIGHGLAVAPAMIIVKELGTANDWVVYHKSLGGGKYIYLNQTAGEASASTVWQNYNPTSSVFYTGTSGLVSQSEPYIAYCFAEKTGYCKIGNYTGNGLTDGTFVYTGFRPSWIMLKRASGDGYEWLIVDDKRDTYNVTTNGLAPNTSAAESGSSYNSLDILSNGFKPRNAETRINNGNGNILYMAFGQSLVGTNNVPCTAR